MVIAEIVRNTYFVSSLTPIAPFIWTGYTHNYEFMPDWEATLGDIFTRTGQKDKVMQVTRGSLNKYIQASSYNDCIAQEMSFYFDETLQQVYIHTEHEYCPVTSAYDYGYSFGVCSSMQGVIYIGDYEYLPLIKSIPDIEQEADVTGSSQPTGMTGSILLDNHSIPDQITQLPRGELDFLLEESVYGNDVFIYDYEDSVLIPVACLYIDDVEHTLEEVSLDLQDKRFA